MHMSTGIIPDDMMQKEDRETRGSQVREKDWWELEDTSILLRTELFTDEETSNFCNYAELIFEELAKQINFKSAHYDLIKYKGKKGVLSQDVRQESEEMHTLSEFVPTNKDYENVVVNLEDVLIAFKELIHSGEFYKEDILNTRDDFVKMLILDCYTMSVDRHLENCALLTSKGEDGKKHIKFAPTFDNECSFMLDIPKCELEKMKKDSIQLESRANLQEPLILLSDSKEWQDTLDFLTQSEKYFDFASDCSEKLDIQKAISDVEKRIGKQLPDLAKSTAINAFEYRKQVIIEELGLDLNIDDFLL